MIMNFWHNSYTYNLFKTKQKTENIFKVFTYCLVGSRWKSFYILKLVNTIWRVTTGADGLSSLHSCIDALILLSSS